MNVDESRRQSAGVAVAWALIAGIALAGLVVVGTESILWGSLVVIVAIVASLPALAFGERSATVAWPLLGVVFLAALARIGRFYMEAGGYLTIIALALIVVIELDSFTPVELSRRFAVVFSVMMTMALQAVWIIAQSASDRWLATDFLYSQTELQWDIVTVTVLATVVGALYYGFAIQFGQSGSITIPDDDAGAR